MASLVPATTDEPIIEMREASPAHFLFKIESFSLLQKHKVDKYETGEFVAGGYKWRLIIYPNGRRSGRNGEGYVSVYLAIADTTAQSSHWEVNAAFSICLFNQISCNYRYTLGTTRRFLAMKTEWGFSKFISKKDLRDPSNGYIMDDECVFGAEVFVNESKAVIESLSLESVDTFVFKREFKIKNFSTLKDEWVSDQFTAGGQKWELIVYPNGCADANGCSLSIFVNYVPPNKDVPCETAEIVRASYVLCMKNQTSDEHHVKNDDSAWFSASECSWGCRLFIDLATLNDPNKGYIVNDCCHLDIELSVEAVARGSPSSILC